MLPSRMDTRATPGMTRGGGENMAVSQLIDAWL